MNGVNLNKIFLKQEKILKIVFSFDNSFYLTGGTALNRFYFPYRISEDLEIFSSFNRDDFYKVGEIKRGFYLTIQSILTDSNFKKYTDFLNLIGCDELIIYGIHKELGYKDRLFGIISRLKFLFPEMKIFIAGENYQFFYDFSKDLKLLSLIDGFYLEYEFWNPHKYKVNSREHALRIFMENLLKIKTLTNEKDILLTSYFGWFKKEEAEQFTDLLDSILIHAYLSQSDNVYDYIKERFEIIYNIKKDSSIYLIFSAENQYFYTILKEKGIKEIENQIYLNLKNDLNMDMIKNIKGFYWFTLEFCEKIYK